MLKKNDSPLVDLASIAVLLFLLFYILIAGATLIIPFVVALLFSFAIIGLSNFYKKWNIPSFLAFIFSIATYIFIIWLIWKMIGTNIEQLIKLLPVYQNSIIEQYNHYAVLWFGGYAPESIGDLLKSINLQSIFTTTLGAFTSIFSRMGLIIFFLIFILLENRYLNKKLYLMLKNNPNNIALLETFEKIKLDVKTYFKVKTMISMITGIFIYLVALAFGLDFAIFWGFLAFILNFIPNIGAIIAVIIPTIISFVQPGFTPYDTLFMALCMTGVQVLGGNIIEPQFMGNRLNLSPLVIIISLAFWGIIWGVVGMLLSVPIMVIINIILSKIPATRPIAILLSEKGDLQVESEDVEKRRKRLIKSLKDKFEGIKRK